MAHYYNAMNGSERNKLNVRLHQEFIGIIEFHSSNISSNEAYQYYKTEIYPYTTHNLLHKNCVSRYTKNRIRTKRYEQEYLARRKAEQK